MKKYAFHKYHRNIFSRFSRDSAVFSSEYLQNVGKLHTNVCNIKTYSVDLNTPFSDKGLFISNKNGNMYKICPKNSQSERNKNI